MNRLVYQVLVGESRPLWEKCVASIGSYCARHGLAHIVQREPILRIHPGPGNQRSEGALRMGYLPIFEKTQALAHLDEFDQVAVIDADVYATPDAPNIFEAVHPATDFAAVLERRLPLNVRYRAKLDRYEKLMFGPVGGCGLPFFNGGVMVFNRSIQRLIPEGPAEFLRRQELQCFIDGVGQWRYSSDQILWNYFLRFHKARVQPLDPRLNWLWGMVERGREQDGWLHHFLLSDHIVGDDPVLLLASGGARNRI